MESKEKKTESKENKMESKEKEATKILFLSDEDRALCIEKILTKSSEFLIGILSGILERNKDKEDEDRTLFLLIEFKGDEEILDHFISETQNNQLYKLHDYDSLLSLYPDSTMLIEKVKEIEEAPLDSLALVVIVKGENGEILDIKTSVFQPFALYLESLLPYTMKITNEKEEQEIIKIELSPYQKKLATEGLFTYYKNGPLYDIMFKDEKTINHYLERTVSNMKLAGIFDNLNGMDLVSVEMNAGVRDLISFYNSYISKTTGVFFKSLSEYEGEPFYSTLVEKVKNNEIPIVFTMYMKGTDNVLGISITSTVK